jgi:hypothetical protein
MNQPFCRCCGKPIRKRVITHYFGLTTPRATSYSVEHAEPAKTKAEAQRHLNGEVVSVRYGYQGQVIAGVWDGESYEDELFCTQTCAAAFGRMAAKARPELETQAAHDARLQRTAEST